MGRANLLVYLNIYKDSAPSNNPSLSNVKWQRDLQGLSVDKPQSLEFCLSPGESKTLVSGTRTLLSDGTTEYSLTLKNSSTYVIKNTAGTAPSFRTARSIASDATTVVTVATSGSLATFNSTSGTLFDFSTVQVGDEVSIGSNFNVLNRGRFKVLSKTSTSITVENPQAVAEVVTLGVNFSTEFKVYSSSGVQVGDKLVLGAGFNSINQNTYEVTGVENDLVEFYSSKVLPQETGLLAPSVVIYSSAKKIIYLETDKTTSLQVNGQNESKLEPFIEPTNSLPGIFLKRSVVYSLTVTNNSSDMATLFFISAE